MRVLSCLVLVLSTTGCTRPDPAPEDIDGALHFLWDGWDEGEEGSLAEAVGNLDTQLAELSFKGAQSRLVTEQIAHLQFSGEVPDPQLTNGMFVATEMGCTYDEIAEVFTAKAQDEQYEGTYDSYERTYTSDDAAWRSGEADRITWDVEIGASPAGFDYVEFISGGARKVEGGPASDILLARTWLREPATEDDDNRSFDQDYQLDVYWEREDATMVHIWAIWRQIDMGTFGDQDSTALIAVTLAEGEKWDEETTELCEGLRE